MILVLHQAVVGGLSDVDFARFSGGLSSAGQVDRVAKKAVAWHTFSNHTSDHFTRVNANGQFLPKQMKKEKSFLFKLVKKAHMLKSISFLVYTHDSFQIFSFYSP